MSQMTAIQVREATAEDAGEIAAYNAAMAMETEHRELPSATVRRGVERGLGRPDACRYYLATIEGRTVGQMMVTTEWSDWRDGVFWWIQSVYVEPAARRRGVFRALYAHVRQMGERDADCRGLRLYVERDNAAAAATYQSLGMSETAYRMFEVDWSR